MRRLIVLVFSIFISLSGVFAQPHLNSSPEGIVGTYRVLHQGECADVQVYMEEDSTFTAKVIWVDAMYDKHGRLRLDKRNPDKSLRDVRCDQIVLMKGLKYDAEKQRWSGTRIYDPTRGFRSPVVCEFRKDKGLRVRINFLCFAQSSYWKRLDSSDHLEKKEVAQETNN